MKKLIFSLLLFPATAFCAHHAGVHGGTDYTKWTNQSNGGQKIGYCLGASYAYDLGENWQVEGEVTFRKGDRRTVYNEAADGKEESKLFRSRHSWSYMANISYQINQLAFYSITPYLGAGAGYSQNVNHHKTKSDLETISEKERDSDFAWQGFIGFKYPVAQEYTLNARYCYFAGQVHTKSHAVRFGLERAF